ncbi:MAG: alpha/beta fold hydrolase [Candidatus Omnitrophota bacterium]
MVGQEFSEMKHIAARDGAEIYYREWKGDPEKDVLVYLHGIESHTGWFVDTAELLNKRGYRIYAMERRGSGINRTNRGYMKNYHVLVDDLRRVLEHVKKENPGKKVYLMGLCWGGKLAVTYAALKYSLIDGLILISPAIKTKVDLPLWQKVDVLFSNFLKPKKLFDVPIEDSMFTKNPKYLEFIKNDKLKLNRVTARFFFETAKMDMCFNKIAGRIHAPIMLLLAGDDRVVDNSGVRKWFEREGSQDKTLKVYQGSCHSLEFEEEAKGLVDDICRWVDEHKS